MGQPPLACVVEDSPPTRKLIEVLLTKAGFLVVAFGRIGEALQWLAQHRPVVVLSDLILPDGHGVEIVKAVRSLPNGWDIPVIAVTGLTQESDRQRYLQQGFDAYIVKPLSTTTFAYEVQQIVEQRLQSVA
ncbi:MAG: response regulator [Candidatus Kapabacteria bacterium]|nr:response regulator [Candidatus Kapabacteria bacterium]MDW8012943.1 response regulator [Bacteroidota bacterium]